MGWVALVGSRFRASFCGVVWTTVLGLLSLERFRMQGSFGVRFCRKLGHVGALLALLGLPTFHS